MVIFFCQQVKELSAGFSQRGKKGVSLEEVTFFRISTRFYDFGGFLLGQDIAPVFSAGIKEKKINPRLF
jgi:hypothetical protein